VINSLVLKALGRQTVVCTPAVGHYSCACRIHVLITERRVSESLDGTGTRKVSQVPRSKPPKTQNPSIHLSLLYFWWPILASSISTILPGPPKTSERCSIQNWHTSLQNEPQSVTLFWLMANSRDIWRLLGWGNTNHREQKRQIVFEKISAYRTMFPLPSSLRMNVFSWPSIAPV